VCGFLKDMGTIVKNTLPTGMTPQDIFVEEDDLLKWFKKTNF
jgi:hypothetical protein